MDNHKLNIIDYICLPLFMLSIPATFVFMMIDWITANPIFTTISKICLFTGFGTLMFFFVYLGIYATFINKDN